MASEQERAGLQSSADSLASEWSALRSTEFFSFVEASEAAAETAERIIEYDTCCEV